MRFIDLRSFLKYLDQQGDLLKIEAEVNADQEVTIIQHQVLAEGGPALFFSNIKNSSYRLVSNLFGTPRRVEWAFGRHPAEIGQELVSLAEDLLPPSPSALWRSRKRLWRLLRTGMRNVHHGPILEQCHEPPDLHQLPCLKCWPLDGGHFFTLPLVHTVDPQNNTGNLGIYRLQRFDATSTGMHWQIEKGGGFHFQKAAALSLPLTVSVFLGGPPALTIAAIAPLPEGIDERLLASIMLGCPLEVIFRKQTGHRIPAHAEFVLEGRVSSGDMQQEGPFGDHLGHYSHSAKFPVYRVDRLLARRDAIYPATVVGKPPQEDYFIGEAIQEMTLPLLKLIKPGIGDLWAYPETGFHPLAVASVRERYPREALKHALAILGEGQLSLTKILVMVSPEVNVRNFGEVSHALWKNLDAQDGLYLLVPTAQDTLDFTGPSMNSGSRLVLIATDKGTTPLPRHVPQGLPSNFPSLHPHILGLTSLGDGVLMAQVQKEFDRVAIAEALARHPLTRDYLFQVLVSEDVPLTDPRLCLWGWFTRFDPALDLYPSRREIRGNHLILHFPILIDATWKTGYRQPVAFAPDKLEQVKANWSSYHIPYPFKL